MEIIFNIHLHYTTELQSLQLNNQFTNPLQYNILYMGHFKSYSHPLIMGSNSDAEQFPVDEEDDFFNWEETGLQLTVHS